MPTGLIDAAHEARLIAFNLFMESLAGGRETIDHADNAERVARAAAVIAAHPASVAEVHAELANLLPAGMQPAG